MQDSLLPSCLPAGWGVTGAEGLRMGQDSRCSPSLCSGQGLELMGGVVLPLLSAGLPSLPTICWAAGTGV